MDRKKRKNRMQGKNIRWLLKQYRAYRWKIAGLIFLQCAVSLLGVLSVVVNKYLVDRATQDMNLTWGIVTMIGVTALSVLINLFVQLWMITFQEKCSFTIRENVYHSILHSRMHTLKKYHSEDVLTRLTSDVEKVSDGVIYVLIHGIGTFVKMISALVLLAYYDLRLAFAIMIIAPAGVGAFWIIGRKMRYIQENYQKTEANYRVFLQESLRNMPVLKAFAQEGASETTLGKLRDERMRWLVKKRTLRVISSALIHVTFTLGTTLAFVMGVVQIASGAISYGTMTAFLSLVGQVQTPVLSLSEMARRFISALASVPRIAELEDLKGEEAPADFTKVGGVTLRGEKLSFAYDTDKIFDSFSFDVRPGEIVGIVGQSGAGKTTLIKLMLGFALPDGGRLEIENALGEILPISAATRSCFSYVPQGNTLFHGTIRENLLMGDPNADDGRLCSALQSACALEFVQKLPNGLDTMLGEQSSGISEGQAQRIAIARALLRKAPVVIFDEATSALDEATELHILEHIKNKTEDTTYLIITHRKKALEYCTKQIEIG